MVEVFLDTSFAIALSSVTDQNHLRAVELAQQLEAEETLLVTKYERKGVCTTKGAGLHKGYSPPPTLFPSGL
jgi:hypothetical protein